MTAERTSFQDLFDIEKRPGAGVRLWTQAVELQLARVQATNARNIRAAHPESAGPAEGADASWELHIEAYFLALAIRRLLLFHELLVRRVADPRLAAARQAFNRLAPNSKTIRNFYEHLDEYLVDSPRKHVRVTGRVSPILRSRWDCKSVVVAFGPHELDLIVAATTAIELGKVSETVWNEELDRVNATRSDTEPPDDGVARMIEVTFGVSAVIGGPDDPPQVMQGTLVDVALREMTPEEVAAHASEIDAPKSGGNRAVNSGGRDWPPISRRR